MGGEESKSGWEVSDISRINTILPEIQAVLDLPQFARAGIDDHATARDRRRRIAPLLSKPEAFRDRLASLYPQADWHELSMGTSADYTVAVEEGATLVRVGTAIVGARNYKSKKEAE